MIEVIFLLVLAAVWLAFAAILDLKTTIIPNWISFSLVILALGFRFFYSLFGSDGFGFFYQGLIGFGIFFILENLFYYGRIFAGGDAKLMMALGAVLPFSDSFRVNAEIFLSFIVIFLLASSLYVLAASGYFAARNGKKFRAEFAKRYKASRKWSVPLMLLGIILMALGFMNEIFFFAGILVFISPLLYIYSKSVDEACMIKKASPEKLLEGDWLYHDVRVNGKTIKSSWDGLSAGDIRLLRKAKKKVWIRQGVASSPVFLISLLVLVYAYFINTGLWNSFW